MTSSISLFLLPLRKLLSRQNIAYASTSFGASLMGSIFGLYQVDLFTSVYKLDASYFYTVQAVYAVWNAMNDPLFGWIIDNTASGSNKRLPAIKWGGPLWAIAFLTPWWPWTNEITDKVIIACQYCFCLSAYDSFLTYVLLVHCALFADLTTSNFERNQLNLLRTYASVAGSATASLSYLFWDKENFISISLLLPSRSRHCGLWKLVAFWYTGTTLKLDRMDKMQAATERKSDGSKSKSSPTLWQFSKQIIQQKNFWMYVAMNFVQNFHATFNSNYWIFFMDKVVEPLFPTFARRLFVFISFYAPHVMIPLLTPFANRYGKHWVIYCCTVAKVIVGILLLMIDLEYWPIWAPMFLINRLLMSSWGFYDVVIADVIDEDMVLNRRTESMSTSVHGVQALFVKPAQSLAPIYGVYALTEYAINHSKQELLDEQNLQFVQQGAYFTFGFVTLVCGVAQLIIWRQYGLHGAYLEKIKSQLNRMEDEYESVATKDPDDKP